MYDLIILGGGPAGYVAAERAGHAGLSVLLFETKSMGGVCLNEGCIPTKTLLYSAKMYDHACGAQKYGVTAEQVRFDYAKMVGRKDRVVRRMVAGVDAQMKNSGVTVVKGFASVVGKTSQGVTVGCNETMYEAKNLLIATGSEALVPPIPGIAVAGDRVLTNREVLALTQCPASLVIIGGGVIGMEFASFFNSLGVSVTVIEMLPEILGGLDREIAGQLREMYARKGVTFHLNAKVVRIEGDTVYFEKQGDTASVTGERLLVSVGRRPVVNGFGLETLGLEMERGGIKVDEAMRTNVPGVYAAGDVTGFSLLAHTASREGEVVVDRITGGSAAMNYRAIPGVVYTNPEVAGVGYTEEQAQSMGLDYRLIKLPMAFSGRFVAENDGVNGLCKVLVASDDTVLGVHILGNSSSEIIFGACMAMARAGKLSDLKEVVFPHPTVSEMLREAAFH
jgi:dihydrolipoamide dehydrogenase